MWKFRKSRESEAQIEGSVTELAERVRALESRQQAVETEWATTQLKIRRLVGHLTKTAALDDPKPETPQYRPINPDDLTVEQILSMPVPFAVEPRPQKEH